MNWNELKLQKNIWEIFKKRSSLITKIHEFFNENNFLAVQTPVLSSALIPESYLEVFSLSLENKNGALLPVFLTPSPELWHKKLLAAGSGNIYEITKSFRNTDIGGSLHNPEFTLLEWYRVNADCADTMKDCEELLRFLVPSLSVTYQNNTVSLEGDFERLSVLKAFEKYAGIKETEIFDKEILKQAVLKKGYLFDEEDTWEDIYNFIYVKDVEPNLGFQRPTFIYNFPAQFAPLAKTNQQDARLKERFELYIAGVELADAYNELTDPAEQRKQFDKEQAARQQLGKSKIAVDYDFIKALEAGIPDCSGVALGIDRLIMILTDQRDINDVILFSGKDIFGSLC